MRSEIPIYRAIAVEIARRIINDDLAEGARLSGRTLLASQYGTSPETVRKAVALLKEEGVADVSQGREIVILSKDNAFRFIERFQSVESVYSLRQDLELLLRQKQEIDAKLEELLKDIINHTDRLRNLTPYNPAEIEVGAESRAAGKTLGQLRLWQHTGATVVAVRRGTELTVSPGPNTRLAPLDRLVVIGDADALRNTAAYLKKI